MKAERVPVALRLPPPLFERLNKHCEARKVSRNAALIQIITVALERNGR